MNTFNPHCTLQGGHSHFTKPKTGSERSSNSLRATELVRGEVRVPSQTSQTPNPLFFPGHSGGSVSI